MADLTSLAVPSCETGFIPIPHDSGNRIFANFSGNSAFKNALSFSTPSEPRSNSMPA